MRTWNVWFVGMLLLGGQSLGAAETVTLSGKIQDAQGLCLANLEMELTGDVGGETAKRTITTDADGVFSAEVPRGIWTGVPSEVALLERGYFCVPGFLWDPDQEIPEGGEFTEIPGQLFEISFTEGITLTAVAVLPVLTVKERNATTKEVTLEVGFKFPQADQEPPEFSGTYIVERSEDLETWELVETLWLDSTTDSSFVDSAANSEAGRCYYRSRREGSLIIMVSEPPQ